MKSPKLLATLTVLGLAVAALLVAPAASAQDASADTNNVLVVGLSLNRGKLVASLQETGASVTTADKLPAGLNEYQEIWTLDTHLGMPRQVEEALIGFTRSGGSLYLAGGTDCCEQVNYSNQRIARAVLKNQEIIVGLVRFLEGTSVFNPDAEGDISRAPNVLTDFFTRLPGGLRGIGDVGSRNVFASNGEVAVGGVWAERDMKNQVGRLVMLMDNSWIDSEQRLPVAENIHLFLSEGVMSEPIDTGVPTATPIPTRTPVPTATSTAVPVPTATVSPIVTSAPPTPVTSPAEPTVLPVAPSAPTTTSSSVLGPSTSAPIAGSDPADAGSDALASTGAESLGAGLTAALALLAAGAGALGLRKRSTKASR